MGFLDKVTKAVGDVVDKGKKEADQFMRIQRIKGEIGDMERKIAGFTTEIQQTRTEAGTRAIEMLRTGTLDAAALQPFADKATALEKAIGEEQEKIAGKRADIEKIKAEDDEPKAAPVPPPMATSAPPPVPPMPAAPPLPSADPMAPPPLPGASAGGTTAASEAPVAEGRACPKCGTRVSAGAFCTECGEKLG